MKVMAKHPVRHEELVQDLGTIFRHGQVLRLSDIGDIALYYDYETPQSANDIMSGVTTRKILNREGVSLVEERRKGVKLFRLAGLPPEETNIEEVKANIDEEKQNRIRQMIETKQKAGIYST